MKFATIPVRINGTEDVDASWWNDIRTAGLLVDAFLGAGFIAPTDFNIANNQSAFADITGLLIDGTLYRSAAIDLTFYRNTTSTGATELSERSMWIATYKTVSGTWELVPIGQAGDAGITLQMTNAGQVQYKTSNITGTAATSKVTFSARTTGI